MKAIICALQKLKVSLLLLFWVRYLSKILTPIPVPVSSEIFYLRNSDFTPCTHAQHNILRIKYAEKTDH